MWPASIVLLMVFQKPSNTESDYKGTWMPQIFKACLGAVLELLLAPAFFMYWHLRAGWTKEEFQISSHSSGVTSAV